MKLTRSDLNLLIDGARKNYIEFSPTACLPGEFKALTDSERISLSWFQSAIQVLNKKGFIENSVDRAGGQGIYAGSERESLVLEFDHPDFSAPFDGYDAAVDLEDEEPKS